MSLTLVARGTIQSMVLYTINLTPHRKSRRLPTEELANESRSTHITVAADMVFSLSHYLSGVSSSRFAALTFILTMIIDCHCRLCSGFNGRFVEGNPVVWLVPKSSFVQSPETR